MLRSFLACCLCVLPIMWHTTHGDEFVPSPLERWTSEVSVQLRAAQAELMIQQQITASTEEQYRRGDVSSRELQAAREFQLQAMEWAEMLQSEAAAVASLPVAETEHPGTENITYLRVPGLPLLFASADFFWVELPQTPGVMRIIDEVRLLDQELHDIAESATQTEKLQQRIDWLSAIQPSTPEVHTEIESLTLHLNAAKLNPERLADTLRPSVIQSRVVKPDRRPVSSRVPSAELVSITQRWARRTRQVRLAQTDRAVEHLHERLSFLNATAADHSVEDYESVRVQQQIESQQSLADSLRRDLIFLQSRDTTRSQSVSTHSRSRAGHLMRIMKQRWEQAKADAHESDKTPVLPTGAATRGIPTQLRLERELQIAETQLKYAMELYRLDSGRSDDPSGLLEHRTQLFGLAADLRVEKADLENHLNAARQHAATRQENPSEKFTSLHEESPDQFRLRFLELEQKRLLIQERRATLCLKLAKLTTNRQAVAQYEN